MKFILGPEKFKIDFEFKIPETDKIGIFMSGGLDSTALLSLIITELKNSDRLDKTKIIAFTVKKPTLEPLYAKRMLSLVTQHFNINIQHDNDLENNLDHYKSGNIDPIRKVDMLKKYPNILMYTGFNNTPPTEIKPFEGELGFVYKSTILYKNQFIDMLKTQLIDLYSNLNIEHLIPYTHSCSRMPIGRCNRCYSCNERKWGFTELNLIDPETINLN